MEDLIELTHGFRELEEKKRHQLAYLVTSSLNAVGQSYGNMFQSGDFHDNVDTIKSTLERYGYLMFVLLKYLGKEDFSQVGNARSQKSVPREVLARWKSNCTEVENGLTAVITVLNLDLSKVFVTTPERFICGIVFTTDNQFDGEPRENEVGSYKIIDFQGLVYCGHQT